MVDLTKLEKIKTADDVAQEAAVDEARRYLRETDWYVLRQFETGAATPEDIKEARNAARATMSTPVTDA